MEVEEKVKEVLGSTDDVESWIKDGIQWLETNPDATKEQYEEKQKECEDKIKPVMMKLYTNGMGDGPGGSDGPGPKVEEVD